ncbi:MAG: hypothetical protein MJY99_02180 [Fibrobacter sp.]|nr:hypothetical protein [Fibrobacter sp.]
MKKYLSPFFFLQLIVLTSCTTDAGEWSASDVCPESKRGTFVDERDGREYKYTTIGDQVWMAENLKYDVEGSLCYYEEDDCRAMGRTYSVYSASCPLGWHIPNEAEWNRLFDAVGGDSMANVRLKSSSGWTVLNPEDDPNGTDECGFSVSYAKYGYEDHYFDTPYLVSPENTQGQEISCLDVYFCSYDRGFKYQRVICSFSNLYVRCVKD